jgi:16S rRNA (guanine527-N7)-methyltransferase
VDIKIEKRHGRITMNNVLTEKVKELSIVLNDKQIQQFEQYYNILVEWNKVMNLTAITEYEEVVEKHFLDSLTIVNAIHVEKIETLIDVGTGAGFPGIPLKIAFPHLKVTLLDSLNKRIKFLNEVIDLLELNDIKAIHGRAEDYAKQAEYREQYDICVSRAVANLATLSEYCLPYVKVDGLFVPYKSGEIDEELKSSEKAVSILGGKVEEVVKFQLPGTDIGRSFVKIHKIKETKKKYPRKAGMPTKEPLK